MGCAVRQRLWWVSGVPFKKRRASVRLRHLVEQIAMVFGAPIAPFGSVDVLLRDAEARGRTG